MENVKTIMLCDGLEVVICRRRWADVFASITGMADEQARLEAQDLSEAQKVLAMSELQMRWREKALEQTVKDWPAVREFISVAGFVQLEKAVDDFSKQQVLEGNS